MAAAPPEHIAQQVLDALVTAVTGLTTTTTNVFVNHPEDRALQPGDVPALLPYLLGEEAQKVSLDGDMVQRTIRLGVGVRIKGIGAIDETLTAIRREVETALAPQFTVGSKKIYFDYVGMQDPELDAENDQPMVSAQLDYTVTLFNSVATPGVLL